MSNNEYMRHAVHLPLALMVVVFSLSLNGGANKEAQAEQSQEEIRSADGTLMVFVPEGEFLYGINNERLPMPAFYIDKYEVTTRLYAAYLQQSHAVEPEEWPKQVSLIGSGDRPVVQVSWHEADAYCRYYGKALPTEQQWEKAARGTDGRLYPWGNETPTDAHALFDARWWGYGTLAAVDMYPLGKSPYGAYNMAGNVWEWTSSDFDSRSKVLRGGSWGHMRSGLQTTHRFSRSPSYRNYFIGFRCVK